MEAVTDLFELRCGRILDRGMLFFLTRHRKASPAGLPNAQVFYRQAGRDWVYHDVDWWAFDMALAGEPELSCHVLGSDGRLLLGGAGGFAEQRIAAEPDRAQPTCIARLGATVAAAGTGGLVLWRDPLSDWQDIGPDGPAELRPRFAAVAGRGPADLVAVGDGGAAWHRGPAGWQREVTGTEADLRDVVEAAAGGYLACGAGGVVLERRHDGWRRLAPAESAADFCSAARLGADLYLADGERIWLLDEDGLQPLVAGADGPQQVFQLDAGDDHLLAVASDAAHLSPDGRSWQPVAF